MAGPALTNPTQELYPLMLRNTRLLIIDYDVTRYHSFDFFRYLMYDKGWFLRCQPEFRKEFVLLHNPLKQILMYKKMCPYINPFEMFVAHNQYHKVKDMEDWMNEHFADKMLIATPTDVAARFGTALDRNDITGFILKYTNDPHTPQFGDGVKVYTSDHVLDLRMAVAVVLKHQINAVMLSSVELAVILASKLLSAGHSIPLTFMIGNYFYNYSPENGALKHMGELNGLEYHHKYEFGIFDPFTGIEEMRQENLLN